MTRLRRAATIAFVLHLVAGAAMGVVLRQGLETNLDFQDRLSFLVNHRALWTLGWLTWTAAAIAILYFYMVFVSTHHNGNLAVFLTAAAIAPDLSAQAIEIGILPEITQQVERFMLLHRTAVLMSGYVANGLYSFSALILAWSTRSVYPAWVWLSGMAVGCFGFMLSAAALVNSTAGMFWSNVLLVPSILLWLAGVALREARS
ncbi:MAG TPA: hypothetical protein VE422_20310 [Terriglobia bacterium]|nr:hypothetical protein [Terriglobia bacterium]